MTQRDHDLREAPNTVLCWVVESVSAGAPSHAASIRRLIAEHTARYGQYLAEPMTGDEREAIERIAWVRFERGEVRCQARVAI